MPFREVKPSARRRPYARTYDQRRQAILQTAWDMMAEAGSDQFSLRELSERSGVSLRTIYNAFDNREGLLAQTLIAHHDSLFEGVEVSSNDSRTLREAVEMCRRVAEETIAARVVAVTTSRAYFASERRSRVADALRALPTSIVTAWMRSDEADQQLVAQFGANHIARHFANAQWAFLADWVADAIDDAQLTDLQTRSILQVALAFGTPAGRAEALALLRA